MAEAPRKILIITADIGAGHDLPAQAVADEFRAEDPSAEIAVINGLPAMGPLMTRVLRENSDFMFRFVPWLFDLQYRLLMNFAPTRWLTLRLLMLFGSRGLLRTITAFGPDVIVSTYPGTTAIIGELRRQGRLQAPCYSSITDLAGLNYWAHPGIDLHFITHPESVEEVEKIAGPGSVRWAKPPTSSAFMAPREKRAARLELDLPVDGTVIAVSGGGWGVGDIIGGVRAALSVPEATVLCLCGHNDRVRAEVNAQFAGDPRLRVMGFTNQMGEVMAASDALIHSSAGLTVLEAIIRGCPVISYGFGYGHVRRSNVALERFGLAQVARRADELPAAIDRALAAAPEPDGSFAARPATAALILANDRRTQPMPAWRVRAVRLATATGSAMVVAWGALTAGIAYSFVSQFTPVTPLTAVATAKPEVGLMVDAAPSEVPQLASALKSDGLHASFVLYSPTDAAVDTADATGDQAVPQLPDGGLVSWLETRHRLHMLLRKLYGDHSGHFLYASSGPSIGQWLFAHGAGGQLIGGHVRLTRAGEQIGGLRPGEVIEIRARDLPDVLRCLQTVSGDLRVRHLHGVPVGELLKDSGTQV